MYCRVPTLNYIQGVSKIVYHFGHAWPRADDAAASSASHRACFALSELAPVGWTRDVT